MMYDGSCHLAKVLTSLAWGSLPGGRPPNLVRGTMVSTQIFPVMEGWSLLSSDESNQIQHLTF